MISVTLNGERREVPEGLNIVGLLEYLGVAGQPLLVEQNNVALLKSEWFGNRVEPDDRIELIRIVAGG